VVTEGVLRAVVVGGVEGGVSVCISEILTQADRKVISSYAILSRFLSCINQQYCKL